MTNNMRNSKWSWPVFLVYLFLLIWAAHAWVFFAHEYSHSFTAWLLGWKDNPLALNYSHATPLVFLIQLGIDQNVDSGALFASGHMFAAAVIAAAGPLLGNAFITLPLSRWGYAKALRSGSRAWAMLAYWATVASIGNFIDYVPIRTFMLDGDIGDIEHGLGCSPWAIIVVLGIPTLLAITYFFVRIQPTTLAALFPESRARRWLIAVLSAAFLFSFYGAVGLLEGGAHAHLMSTVSVFVFSPLMALIGGLLVERKVSLSRPVAKLDR